METAPTDSVIRRMPPVSARARSGHAQFLWSRAHDFVEEGDLPAALDCLEEFVRRWPADKDAQHELRQVREQIEEKKQARKKRIEERARLTVEAAATSRAAHPAPVIHISSGPAHASGGRSLTRLVVGVTFGAMAGAALVTAGQVAHPPPAPTAVAAAAPIAPPVVADPSPIEIVEVTAGESTSGSDGGIEADVRNQVVEIRLTSSDPVSHGDLKVQALGRTQRGLPFASRTIPVTAGIPVGDVVSVTFRTPRAVVLEELQVHFAEDLSRPHEAPRVDRIAIPAAWFELPEPDNGIVLPGPGSAGQVTDPHLTGLSETVAHASSRTRSDAY